MGPNRLCGAEPAPSVRNNQGERNGSKTPEHEITPVRGKTVDHGKQLQAAEPFSSVR